VTSLDDLLTVQELDTRVDQLQHRRRTLPELESLETARRDLTAARSAETECATRLRSVRSSQKEAEDHASLLDDKAAEVQTSLYDGSVTSHKELEALQVEHAMLKEHQAEYEDRALELMEQAEPLESELAGHAAAVAALEGEIERLGQAITVAEAEIDVEVEQVTAERAQAAGGVPAEILAAYDTLRRQLGGVGAARLLGARCEGCHLEIPSAQLEGVRKAPPDALVTCPECFRILVR
jgi:predicted  nucleic acid-binding Zn-ribbon protein